MSNQNSDSTLSSGSAYREDVGESTFVARALEFVESATYDILFPPLEGRKFVPMGANVDPGAQAITYSQYRRTGLAKLVTEDGKDLPTAGFSVVQFSRSLKLLGISYQYTMEELRAAQYASRNGQSVSIDTERGRAAYEAMERAIDVICAIGSATSSTIPGLATGIGPDLGMLGLLNQTAASSYTPAAGAAGSTAWSQKTPDEKVADITGLINSQINGTYKVHSPNVILMPITQFNTARGQRMGDSSDKTVIQFLQGIYPEVTFASWQYCAGAGTAGADRMVAFNSNPRFVRINFARNFTQEAPQLTNLVAKVLCTVKLAGVVCPYPLSITYMDSI